MDAIEVGYHHFDTAAFYQSEQAIGRAVVQALDLIKSRDEIFITSKLWEDSATDHTEIHHPARSFNKERMKQNLEIFYWELGEDEMNKINQIPQRRLYAGDFFVYEVGPYKSFHQLWDGDP
ncbi:hypothetical protein L3X38_029999 [Prunus dulcis]|uniref:NADP-dependent oxidoreductase domain-containing protein n=1 Tax=Prunus dulcis TaxID=3755 RepID=A0AAD4VV76_PRUDU|nr:hypothetical protein L3X38_029999 [Prunus dulcis]